MKIESQEIDTEDFFIEHISDSNDDFQQIAGFEAGNGAEGLENYIKYVAYDDEQDNMSRTYLVKEKMTNELVCYFSLRTGLITQQVQNEKFDSIPAIELSNFAVNKKYRDKHPNSSIRIGMYTFENFVLPLVRFMAKYIGVNALYIYALPEEKLIEHYKSMGFSRLPKKQERFVQHHVKPKYDEGCIFMYQTL